MTNSEKLDLICKVLGDIDDKINTLDKRISALETKVDGASTVIKFISVDVKLIANNLLAPTERKKMAL